MFQFIRTNSILKITWIFMAAHLLNLSVDVAEEYVMSSSEAAQFNEWDSLMEMVLEGAIGFENAFEESSSDEDPDPSTLKLQQFVHHSFDVQIIPNFPVIKSALHTYSGPEVDEGHRRAITPPPQI